MDYEVVKGNSELYEDIIDFGNYVFSLDFPSALPKLYKNHEETAQYHYLIKEDHRIRAMVGSFPLGLTVCGNYLKGRGIGTVSVHKYHRASGFMRSLMDRAIEDIKSEGCDFAVLGGQRQRYEYWGFTPCGVAIMLNFNKANIKHYQADIIDDYRFIEYEASIAADLYKAVKLHDSQPVHAVREKDNFIDISKSWGSKVQFVYKNGEFIGYIASSGNNERILELLLINPEEIDKILVAYMRNYDLNNANVELFLHRPQEFHKLSRFCEDYTIKSSSNIFIINYTSVIKAFLELKNSLSPLEEGSLIINVEEKERFLIEVKDKEVHVEPTDLPYDISLSHLEASAFLFSPSSFVNAPGPLSNPLVRSWFPLPLCFPELDNV